MARIAYYIHRSLKDRSNKVSSTRIQAYITFAGIMGLIAMYLVIFLSNAVVSILVLRETYQPHSEEIVIFGMILAHHLALMGIKNTGDKTLPIKEEDTEKKYAERHVEDENEEFDKECDK